MKRIFSNVLEMIGRTPMVELTKSVKEMPCRVYVKVESCNLGGSIKDRMALRMIEEAEKQNKLNPGFVVIESTSGNTGMGLAIVCAVKRYKCILVVKDKISQEKVNLLKAYGAEVYITPSSVKRSDSRHCDNVAKELSEIIPNSIFINQYSNPSNPQTYYETVAPEIWEQTQGAVTHILSAVGTGGTLVGTSKYLKEQNKKIQAWAVEPEGSILSKYYNTNRIDSSESYPYLSEGFGQDFIPSVLDNNYIDKYCQVSDKEAIFQCRILARDGLLGGFSFGAVVSALKANRDNFSSEDRIVLIMHDNGNKYLSKIYNDD